MFDDVPLIVIDESCFALNLRTAAQFRQNEALLKFIAIAQASHLFSFVLIGHKPAPQLKRQLGIIGFNKKPLNKIPVHAWQKTPLDHADILISAERRTNDYLADSAALHFTPADAAHPDFLRTLINGYDAMLDHSYAIAGKAADTANFKIGRAIETFRMYRRFENPQAVWKKIERTPAVNSLVNAFSGAVEVCGGFSRQDIILAQLRVYFQDSVTSRPAAKALLYYRNLLKSDFREDNIGYRYDHAHAMTAAEGADAVSFEDDARQNKGTARFPLDPAHRLLLDNALRTIHHVLRTEPRTSPK